MFECWEDGKASLLIIEKGERGTFFSKEIIVVLRS